MIFGEFMVHDKIIKSLWKRFNTIYDKNIYIVGCIQDWWTGFDLIYRYMYIYIYIYGGYRVAR